MRSPDFGKIENAARSFSRDETLEIFRKMCLIRHFELNVKNAFDQKIIKTPIYLGVGQEAVASALAVAYKNPAIFAQHRAHDLYLAYGGNQPALVDELLHRPTGCAKGMGGSASIHDPAISMFGHDGLMGTQIPIAVGYAMSTGKRTLAVMGDASAEEDYVLAAMAYAAHKRAPVFFVCMDNNLSILTKVKVRRNWKMADVAKSFGMEAVEITDDPWTIMQHARELSARLPAFMNIHIVRHLWHNGTGTDGPPEWDRFEMVRQKLAQLGFGEETKRIEKEAETYTNSLWAKHLEGTGAVSFVKA